MHDIITPPSLSDGDTVAIVRTGNGPGKTEYPHVYELGLQRLQDVFGLNPVEYPTCNMSTEELSRHPEQRAQDIMKAFQDSEIHGIIAVIGGSGDQIRMLKHLDPAVLRDNPTRFYGYSDNTSLAMYLWNHGIVSFYGPMVMTELAMQGAMHDYTVKHCKNAFFAEAVGSVQPSDRFTDEDLPWDDPSNLEEQREMEDSDGWDWYNATGETVTGRLWGGCLGIVRDQLMADRYVPDAETLDGCILAIETSETVPDPALVERCFMAMGERGLLERFDAILMGRAKARSIFTEAKSAEQRAQYRKEQKQAIKAQVDRYAPDTPIVFDVNFGHTDPIVPLPIGGTAEIDPAEETLCLR